MAEARKTVTVLFADVAGSTALGEAFEPEAVRSVMERYFAEARAAIERHGGVVEKFIGDAVMAVFGVPALHEDDALRAVRAASDLRERMGVLNAELERERGVALGLRTGVNTGEVVAGDASSDEFYATGDAINVAARLEQAAAPGEILLGEQTYRLVRDAVQAEAVEPLLLKGKAAAVPAYRLGLVEEAPIVVSRFDSPFVG
jgi:class 3 adenylate cyclase